MKVKELKDMLAGVDDDRDVFIVDISIPVTGDLNSADGTYDVENIKDIRSLNAFAIIMRSGGCGCAKCQELAKKN